MDSKNPGDLVYVLGKTKNELGGSEYYQIMENVGLNVPKVNVKEVLPLYEALHAAIYSGLISSCHAVSKGGLATHLAMVAIAGETGMDIDISSISSDPELTVAQKLYSESSGRFVITVARDRREQFEKLMSDQVKTHVGFVTDSTYFRISNGNGRPIVEEQIRELKDCWEKPFGDLI
jgi:phosphoribosylformylglycinamidine synthase